MNTDPYREWDVAYVLGSLSPSERKDYERHLSTCATCSDEVASLAGMPGILSAVPREQAAELLEPAEPAPETLMPQLVRAAQTSRRWARIRVAAALAGAAALGAVLAVVLSPSPPGEKSFATTLTQTIPSPVSASVNLVEEPWGTRIEVKCDYAQRPEDDNWTRVYGLYIVDSTGTAVRASTWSAGPGTSMTPSASTDVPRSKISRIEIRLLSSDKTLLEARF